MNYLEKKTTFCLFFFFCVCVDVLTLPTESKEVGGSNLCRK